MLCLADRNFFGFELWRLAQETGADLLWRMKKNMRMAAEKRLPDGSYLSHVYPSERDWRHKTNGIVLRVIDYRLEGIEGAEPIYRLATTILDPAKAPAERIGGSLSRALGDRNRIRRTQDPPARRPDRAAQQNPRSGAPGVLRSADGPLRHPRSDARSRSQGRRRPRPALVPSRRARDPPQNGCPTALFPPRQRRAFHKAVLDEILEERVVSSRNRRNSRGVKRKMSNFPLRPRHCKPLPRINIRKAIRYLSEQY